MDTIQGYVLTTLEAAKAQTRKGYEATCITLNNSKVQEYGQAFAAALAALPSTPTDYAKLPPVPASFIVVDMTPMEGGGGAWPTIVQSGPPVCSPLPIPVDATSHFSDTAKIGQHIGGPYWQALDKLVDNTIPFPGKADDGTTGFWMRRTRFGNLGYYEKVA